MHLISLESNKQSFRTVKFNEHGLNLIVAKQSNPGRSERGKTYNGVGKSLMVFIIHFCLGADAKHYKSFCEKLPGWEFSLKFKIGDSKYTSKRGTDDPKVIIFNGIEQSIGKFTAQLEELCFDLPNGIQFLSFRSLLPFFIRPGLESYSTYDRPARTGSEYQKMLYNAFLIGLDMYLAQQKLGFRKEQERIRTLTENIKKDDVLRDFLSGNKDVKLALKDLEEHIQKLSDDLKRFQVAEDYYDVKNEADRIERYLDEVGNKIVLLDNQLQSIQKSLKISPDLGKENIEKVYNEAGIFFPDQVTASLNDLTGFYYGLIKNRQRKLLEQKNRIEQEKQRKVETQKDLKQELDRKLQYLGAHQALDVFMKVTQRLADLRMQKENLARYENLMNQYHASNLATQEKLLESRRKTDEYLDDAREITDTIQDFFRMLAKRIYPDASSGITIYNNGGDNQIRYDIDARIDADASDGINHVKIFCYDLTLLFKGYGHHIKCLFHDSRLFDAIDERQKTELFIIVAEMFAGKGYQYIASVNQNQLDEIKKHLPNEMFDAIVRKNTILTLTDESDAEKLLGIKVDIRYE
jgi:uncharacterized protein YydD (DUF2326 family)